MLSSRVWTRAAGNMVQQLMQPVAVTTIPARQAIKKATAESEPLLKSFYVQPLAGRIREIPYHFFLIELQYPRARIARDFRRIIYQKQSTRT